MNKKFKWLIGLAGSAMLIMAIAMPVLAAGPQGGNSANVAAGQCNLGELRGLGVGPDESIVELLGLSGEEIKAERLAGKSLVQIASGQGVSEETLVNTIMAEKKAAIQAMVAEGKISQTLADQRLAQIQERVQISVNRTVTGPQSWSGANKNGNGSNKSGFMGRGTGSSGNPGNCTGTPGTCTESRCRTS
jgi:hypothetical protein